MSYRRFVIVGQERTGSVFLQMLLASNPRIISQGEVFNDNAVVRRRASERHRIIAPEEEPLEYLEQFVYGTYADRVEAVGFKLFYHHARQMAWRSIWPYLKYVRVHVIHIRRRNLLDRYLSLRLAELSSQWIDRNGESGLRPESIALEPDGCFADFAESEWWSNYIDTYFAGNPKLDICYEELAATPEPLCAQIQDFLGVAPQPLSSPTQKQQRRPRHEVIENFADLRATVQMGIRKGWAREQWLSFFETVD